MTQKHHPHIELRKLFFTPAEVAKRVGCSRQTVVKWCEQGRLDATRTPGGHWRIPTDVVIGLDPATIVDRVPLQA